MPVSYVENKTDNICIYPNRDNGYNYKPQNISMYIAYSELSIVYIYLYRLLYVIAT